MLTWVKGLLTSAEVEELVDSARAAPWFGPDLADAYIAEEKARAERNTEEKERHRTKKAEADVMFQVSSEEMGLTFVVAVRERLPYDSEEPILARLCSRRSSAIKLPSGDYLFAVDAGRYAGLRHPGVKVAGHVFVSNSALLDWKVSLKQSEKAEAWQCSGPSRVSGVYIEQARAA